jgi:hypothetical protein
LVASAQPFRDFGERRAIEGQILATQDGITRVRSTQVGIVGTRNKFVDTSHSHVTIILGANTVVIAFSFDVNISVDTTRGRVASISGTSVGIIANNRYMDALVSCDITIVSGTSVLIITISIGVIARARRKIARSFLTSLIVTSDRSERTSVILTTV